MFSFDEAKDLAEDNLLMDTLVNMSENGHLIQLSPFQRAPYWEDETDIFTTDVPMLYAEIRDDLPSSYRSAFFHLESLLRSYDIMLSRLAYHEVSGGFLSTAFLSSSMYTDSIFETLYAKSEGSEKIRRARTMREAIKDHADFLFVLGDKKDEKKEFLRRYL